MKIEKVNSIIKPIYESLKIKYSSTSFSREEKKWLEKEVMDEINELSNIFEIREALLFSYQIRQLENDLASRNQKLWRQFIFCHLAFLYGKKILTFDLDVVKLVCDAITIENVYKKVWYLDLLSDSRLMMQVFSHSMLIDFSSTLTNYYKVDNDRLRRIFLFLCKKIEQLSDELPKNMEFNEVKKQIWKQIKVYQSNQIFKRGV